MSAGKVTPIKAERMSNLRFYEGGEYQPSSASVFAGLKGVCIALERLDNETDQFILLSQAARALVEILDERQT